MVSFASSATTGGARKHTWSNSFLKYNVQDDKLEEILQFLVTNTSGTNLGPGGRN